MSNDGKEENGSGTPGRLSQGSLSPQGSVLSMTYSAGHARNPDTFSLHSGNNSMMMMSFSPEDADAAEAAERAREAEEQRGPDAEEGEHHEADEWRAKAEGMPAALGWLYVHLFLVTLQEEDIFQVVMRKLMFTAGALYSPCSIAMGGYWFSLLFAEPDNDQWTARLVAGSFAVAVAIFVFIPAYLWVCFSEAKSAGEALLNYWIAGIGICFCMISIGVPRFPTPVAMYSLAIAAVLSRSSYMLLHIVLAVIIFGITSYDATFLELVHGWATLTIKPKPHAGSNIENIILVLIGAFIVSLMSAALYLQSVEYLKMVNRSSSTASVACAVSKAIKTMDMGTIKAELKTYRASEFTDHSFYHELVGIVQTIAQFSKFCPKEVVSKMLLTGKSVTAKMETRDTVVFFSDIASFTSFCDLVQGDNELFCRLMSLYFEDVARILTRHGLIICKYIGDSVMALSFCDENKQNNNANNKKDETCTLAVCAGLAIQAKMGSRGSLGKVFEREGFELQTRVGLHRGLASVGVMGSKARVAWDAVGASVTLSSRLEGLGKYVASRVTVSEDLLAHTLVTSSNPNPTSSSSSQQQISHGIMSDAMPIFASRRVGPIQVKGRAEATSVYHVCGVLPDAELLLTQSGTGTSQQHISNDSLASSRRNSASQSGSSVTMLNREATQVFRQGGGGGGSPGSDPLPPPFVGIETVPTTTSSSASSDGEAAADDANNNNNSNANSSLLPPPRELTTTAPPSVSATPPSISHESGSAHQQQQQRHHHQQVYGASPITESPASIGHGGGLLSPGDMSFFSAGNDSLQTPGQTSITLGTSATSGATNSATARVLDAAHAVASVARSGARASAACCYIIEQLNSAQLMYERGHFGDAAKTLAGLHAGYSFASSSKFSTPQDEESDVPLPGSVAGAGAHHHHMSGSGGGGSPLIDKRRRGPESPHNKRGPESPHKKRSSTAFNDSAPQELWPQWLIDVLLDEDFLLDRINEMRGLEAKPPRDMDAWAPTIIMKEK